MSRRYWLRYAAFGGLSALLMIGNALGQPEGVISNPSTEAAQHQAAEPNQTPSNPSAPASDNQERSTSSEQRACDDTDDCARKDLLAQQSMAESTVSIVELSRWQVRLGIGALVLSAFTVVFAAWAAWAASAAAKAARDAVKEARGGTAAAVKVANATVAAERARFFVEINRLNTNQGFHNAALYDHPTSPAVCRDVSFSFKFKNFGKTPGVVFEIAAGMDVSSDPVVPVYTILMTSDVGRAYGYGEETSLTHSGTVMVPDMRTLLRGEEYLWLYGKVTYSDVFRERTDPYAVQTHRFFRRVIVRDKSTHYFQPYDYGHYNEST